MYVRRKPRIHLQPLLFGGGHEHGLRAGTLATHQIVGMGQACAIAQQVLESEAKRLLQLQQRLWAILSRVPNIQLNGDALLRIPGNINLSIAGVDGDALIAAVPEVALSTASACAAKSQQPSYVLQALGLTTTAAKSSLRISLGRFTTEQEIDAAGQYLLTAIQKLREAHHGK